MSIKQDRTGTRTSEDLRRRINVKNIEEAQEKVDASVEQVQKLSNQVQTLDSKVKGLNDSVTNTRESYVSTNAQTFTEEQKTRARNNIGAVGRETDPTVPTHVKNITEADISKWNSGTGGGGTSINVNNEYKESTTEPYSCNYINKNIGVQIVTETGTDLNDYTKIGTYFFKGSDVAPTNIPNGTNGWLVVLPGDSDLAIKQMWYRYGSLGNHQQTFVRTCLNGVWSEWQKLMVEPTELYNSSTGTSGNVTLSDSVENYFYIEIFFGDLSDVYGDSSVKIYSPEGKTACLQVSTYQNDYLYHLINHVLISGKTITKTLNKRVRIKSADSTFYVTDAHVKIYRVVGYK